MSTYTVLRLDEIDSTNSYALRNLSSMPDRQVILAEKQTEGYGRFNRHWISSTPENIYMSLVLKPCTEVHDSVPLVNITQYGSVVICEVLKKYDIRAVLKWPNDVLVNGLKIAGLLGESAFEGSRLKGYVLGVGINLNMTPDDLKRIDQPVTSLNLLTNMAINRDSFLDCLLEEFFKGYELFLEGGFRTIRETYIQRSTFLGKKITVITLESRIHGIARNFFDDGSLLIVTNKGEEKKITAGDVIFF